ncbi:MAG: flagellar biosynthetic protein FliR [Candidatus Hydrogenedentes bacterium]|nr:flagellar biosynthetic protein FliR [Candidatus Hydrogenedentota bacterium]
MLFEVEVFRLFLLVMIRFGGLIVAAPILGSRSFPTIAKVGLAALSAMLVTPVVPALPEPLPEGMLEYALLGMGEAVIGLMMGLVMQLVFATVQVAGQIVDMLSGFALMNVFNPALETQVPIFGFFYYVMATLYLLALNGHHLMLMAMASTFQDIPIGGFVVQPELFREVAVWGRAMFYDGLLIAAPPAGALLLAYVSMGMLGRVVPQIHLFVVGFPVTIALGLLTVAFALSTYLRYLDGMFFQMFKNVETLIRGMT